MARHPFSSSISDTFDPYAALSHMPERSGSMPTAYYFLRTVLFAGAIAGGLVALYRNDVFLDLARRVGQESRYLEFEKFVVGTPGWGTPRSMDTVLSGASAPIGTATNTQPQHTATSVAEEPKPLPAAAAEPKPEPSPAAAPPPAAPPPIAAAAPVPAPVEATAAPKPAPVDPLAPVSLDSLPLLGAKRTAPASTPVAAAPSPPAPRSGAIATRSDTSTSGSKSRAAVSVDAPAPSTPKRAPKPEPAPPPEPAPVAAKPEPKGPKPTDARANDNPLLGAIRSAVRARPASDKVPQ